MFFLKNKLNNKFIKNVITLMTGTTIAQAIPIIISPILTRLYTPTEFGLFSVYMSITTILAIFATARYELAIMLPKKNEESLAIVKLSMLINISVSFILFLLVLFLKNQFNLFINESKIGNWIYVIPLSVFLLGLYNTFYYWSNRNQLYKVMMQNRIIQSTSMSGTQLLFGFLKLNSIGLILGYIFSQLTSTIRLFLKSKPPKKIKDNVNIELIKKQAHKYNNFPKYLTFSHSTEALSANMPQILLTTYFGSKYAGFYALLLRVVGLPLSLIGKSVGDVFLQNASKRFAEQGECKSLYLKTFKSLALLAIIPFVILYMISVPLFSFVFGAEWAIAGEYMKIFIIPFYLQFISSPLSHMFIIAQKVKTELFTHIIITTLAFLSFYIGYNKFHSIEISLWMFSIVLTIKYAFFLAASYSFSKGKR